jgi:hypothetical protein
LEINSFALVLLLKIMRKPDIISGANEIINAIFEKGVTYQEFSDIQPYMTSPDEINKNAIVEWMIKTLKQYLTNIFMTYKVVQLYDFYLKHKMQYLRLFKSDISKNDYLLELVREINKNRKHRIIKAIL